MGPKKLNFYAQKRCQAANMRTSQALVIETPSCYQTGRKRPDRWILLHAEVDDAQSVFTAPTAEQAAKKAWRKFPCIHEILMVHESDLDNCLNPFMFNASNFSFAEKKPHTRVRNQARRDNRRHFMLNYEDPFVY